MAAMAEEESSQSQQWKWEGKACAEVEAATAEQVWPLLEDFFSFHKWFPGIDTCEPVEGLSGQPGCIRYCANTTKTTISPSPVSSESESESESEDENKKMSITTTWAKEKLLSIDPVERCMSYEVIENNVGIDSYIATIKLFQLSPPAMAINEGCRIEWSFMADPVQGLTFEGFLSYVQSSLQGMAHKMEDALRHTPTSSVS